MRFHIPAQSDERPGFPGWLTGNPRHLRPTTAGAVSLLFLVALTILLLRRGATHTAPDPTTEPAARPGCSPTEDSRLGHYYTVRPDDTLEGLARQFYRDSARWSDIARANDIRNPRRLAIGRRLWIPAPAP